MKEFEKFAASVCERLYQIAEEDIEQIASCRSGEDFEERVRDAAEDVISIKRIDARVIYSRGSHTFPDIIIQYGDGDKYGIEVKCSTSSTSRSWKINGNSVLGSTKEDVIDTYIVFGKTKPSNIGFRFKRYEDAITNVVVTHSPRYLIDMDVPCTENFFKKSGISYKLLNESNDPIRLITEYFRRQGQRAWWLSESTPAAIRMFSDLSIEEQNEIISYCFVHFPEIFSKSTKKFSRCAMWMVTDRSIVSSSLRDSFTAGGKIDIVTKSATYVNAPRIMFNVHEYRKSIISELESADPEKLQEDWNALPINKRTIFIEDLKSIDDRIRIWTSLVASWFDKRHISEATEMVETILLNK